MIKQILNFGDQGLICDFGDEVKKEINLKVISLFKIINFKIKNNEIHGIKNCTPSYNKLIINFNLEDISFQQLSKIVTSVQEQDLNKILENQKTWKIPVCYDEEYGIDQKRISEYTGLSIPEILNIHQKTNFYIYMIGFMPGFPYMGDLDDKLYTPRLETPRVEILDGSVIIAEKFCAIYPYKSPGGWNILGRTPIKLFDQHSKNPCLLFPGDNVEFYKINLEEFKKLA